MHVKPAPMLVVRQRLEPSRDAATRFEPAISSLRVDHLAGLRCKTGAPVTRKISFTNTPLGRSCRAIGPKRCKDLKAVIGGPACLSSDLLRDFKERSRQRMAEANLHLEKEISLFSTLHEMAGSPRFAPAIDKTAMRRHLCVVGFQAACVHLRPSVGLCLSADKPFAGVLTTKPNEACLMVRDGRRWLLNLALAPYARGLRIVLVTDTPGERGHKVATEIFAIARDVNHFWDTTMPIAKYSRRLDAGLDPRPCLALSAPVLKPAH